MKESLAWEGMQCFWDLDSSGGLACLEILLVQPSAAPEWGQGVCVWPKALEKVPCLPAMEVSK